MPAWWVTAASETGAHHVAKRMAYEDAWAVAPAGVMQQAGSPVVVAVADGHGHARHFRSAKGAEIAVAIAVRRGTTAAADIAGAGDAEHVEKALGRLAPAIVSTWRDHVRRDLAEHPVTDEERSAAGLGARAGFDDLVYGYGTTLLVAIAAGPWLGCIQLGDGDLFVLAPDGSTRRPVPIDPRLDGLRTTSLCQPDAVDSIRHGVVNVAAEPVGAVMLATDGYGNAQRRDGWTDVFGADVAAIAARHGTAWIGERLPDWVRACASASGSGDDVTAMMMFAVGTRWRPDAPGNAVPDDAWPTIETVLPTVRDRPVSTRLAIEERTVRLAPVPRPRPAPETSRTASGGEPRPAPTASPAKPRPSAESLRASTEAPRRRAVQIAVPVIVAVLAIAGVAAWSAVR